MKYIITTLILFLTLSCTHKNTKVETQKYADKLVHDQLDINGNYYWSFQLMGGEQLSYHTFHADSIEYTMEGKVYSTRYTMQKLSFDRTTNKWIGEDENNIVYVLFFKEVTDSTLVLYKHKCKSNGLKEAVDFKLPEPDATEDHGWNVYYKNTDHSHDKLPVSGVFLSKEGISINISDKKVWLALLCQVTPLTWFSVFTNWNFQNKGVCGYRSSQVILKLDKVGVISNRFYT